MVVDARDVEGECLHQLPLPLFSFRAYALPVAA
jgi:hypothetical protein